MLSASSCFSQLPASSARDAGAATSEQVRLSEILIATPKPYDPAQGARAEQKAKQVREAVLQGGDFASLAKANSDGPTAAVGGDLGCFSRGILAPSLDELVFRMRVNDVSDVVRTKQGVMILKVTDRGAHPCAIVESLTPPASKEMKRYEKELMNRVRQKWYDLIPQSARQPQSTQGTVTVEVTVEANGALAGDSITLGSGDGELDDAALKAIQSASPFPPLPSSSKKLVFRFRFQYNLAKTAE